MRKMLQEKLWIKVINILTHLEAAAICCILDAPVKKTVEKDHDKIGVKYDWIVEVKTTQKTWGASIKFLCQTNILASIHFERNDHINLLYAVYMNLELYLL